MIKKGKSARKVTSAMIQYDRATGIVMLRARLRRRGEKSHRTREVAPGWIVDFDQTGQIIEIEVLDSSAFPTAVLKLLPHEFDPPTGPRAKRSVQDVQARPDGSGPSRRNRARRTA